MTTKYNPKFNINPTGGFNRLSLGNPFNNFSREFNTAYLSQNKDKFNEMNLEENKIGLKTTPHPPLMTNSLNINDSNIVSEQKFNPYYNPDNYPQRIDSVKDLMNNSYHEIRVPNPSNNNIQRDSNQKFHGEMPPSSRVPMVEKNVFQKSMNNSPITS